RCKGGCNKVPKCRKEKSRGSYARGFGRREKDVRLRLRDVPWCERRRKRRSCRFHELNDERLARSRGSQRNLRRRNLRNHHEGQRKNGGGRRPDARRQGVEHGQLCALAGKERERCEGAGQYNRSQTIVLREAAPSFTTRR